MNEESTFEVAIIGAGAFGLSIARTFVKAGYSVVVIEKNRVGAGASGGNLGALMPHMPARWDPNKEFQFHALSSLAKYVQELEVETDYSVGYQRVGRLIPLFSSHMLAHSKERARESKTHWHSKKTGFEYFVLQESTIGNWMNPEIEPLAYAFDTFAARILPWRYVNALRKSIESSCTLLEHTEVTLIDPESGTISIGTNSDKITANQIVLAAGYESYSILNKMGQPALGVGIKGQSVLLKGHTPDQMPIIFDDGVFIVPHFDGTVAVGSSAIENWTKAAEPDLENLDFFERAKQICTPLRNMEIVEYWANVRPKCFVRDPMIGSVPGFQNFFVATGGFKIGLGLVHRLSQALFEHMTSCNKTIELPTTYTTTHHWHTAQKSA